MNLWGFVMDLSVLIIEDEKQFSSMLKESLDVLPIFKSVVQAFEGNEAVRKITNQKFDIILVDIGLPKRDGLEVLAAVKDKIYSDKAKIIMISAGFTSERIVEAKRYTPHFLAKPFDLNSFKMKIGEVVKEIKE